MNYEVCYVCQEGNCSNENLMLCCDECPQSYHMLCLDPPIAKEDIPDGSWYCQHCKIAKAHAKGGTKGKPKELPFKPVASWKEGSKLEIQYEGNQQWYPATIAMKSKKRVKIAYDGWDRKFSEWVKKTSIRIAPPGVHITDKSKVPAVPQFARPVQDSENDKLKSSVKSSRNCVKRSTKIVIDMLVQSEQNYARECMKAGKNMLKYVKGEGTYTPMRPRRAGQEPNTDDEGGVTMPLAAGGECFEKQIPVKISVYRCCILLSNYISGKD